MALENPLFVDIMIMHIHSIASQNSPVVVKQDDVCKSIEKKKPTGAPFEVDWNILDRLSKND